MQVRRTTWKVLNDGKVRHNPKHTALSLIPDLVSIRRPEEVMILLGSTILCGLHSMYQEWTDKLCPPRTSF